MIRVNPDRIRAIELTPKEQKTILKHCRSLDGDMYDRIRTARNGVLHLLEEECHYLRECLYVEINRISIPKVKNILGNFHNKLALNPVARIFAEEFEGHDFGSIEEANEKLQEIMNRRNVTPDPTMGGLSPNQVTRLVYLSWDDDRFPLKFNTELTLSELKDSVFFTNARTFLQNLKEQSKENTATAAGNLNRKFVKLMFDKLIISEDHKKFILEYKKVINEEDVFALHIPRVVCQSAGLIHKRKNKFLVLKKYHSLLSDEKAGELYALLFNSYFTKFNIGYADALPELAGVQHTIAYSIYRLGEIAAKYRSMAGLAEEILLPAVLEEVEKGTSEYIRIEWVLGSRILEPLKSFGLVELKYKQFKRFSEIEAVRKTELFDRFVRCEW
jgi:hypothetical protein